MTLFKKILAAMLLISLLPLIVSAIILALNLGNVREKLASRIAAAADLQASESLRQRAEQVATNISGFLKECEGDLRLLAALPRSPRVLKAFYDSRKGLVWHRSGPAESPHEVKEWIPHYSALAVIDRNGQEICAIRDGRLIPQAELRNVSNPANTEYRSEEYFNRVKTLKAGEIYVSHLTGFHLSKDEQLAGAADPEHSFGRSYKGVIRFGAPLFDARGKFAGMVLLSLDHRQLMEFSQHILPGKNTETVFPSYKSGNYAFLFDDEGWIITHPKFWDIRGLDPKGRPIPPYNKHSSPADVESGRIPFNLDQAGFVHPNYPQVAAMARQKKSGYVDITNVGGARKMMAFAPILYDSGDYKRYGIFGAVTIGYQVDQFHGVARAGVSLINHQLHEHIMSSTLIVTVTSFMVVLCAWLLSRGVTRPLALLAEGTRQVAEGSAGNRVEITSNDEIGELADNFNKMAEELEVRKNSLLRTLDELSSSRKEILEERDFKESILESISSAILTISPAGRLTSINGTGKKLLGERATPGTDFTALFTGFSDMAERIGEVLAGQKGYGREPLIVERDDVSRYFEVGYFPIGEESVRGITVTMRDETVRERLREEMIRMDRLASLGRLSAGIAHEVRNPLTGISLLLDDLHDRSFDDPNSQTMMRKALQEIERVERLVSALLNFASPPKAQFREGELDRVIHDTILLLRRLCEQHRVGLSFVPAEVPRFFFDGEKIKQAVLNLIKNGLEAMPEGGTIEVATRVDEGWAIITIKDNGPGIAEKDLPLIFEPFFTRKGGGTGLGLSITRRIVEEHHGKIGVESDEGRGTVFIIQLPMKTGNEPTRHPEDDRQ